jgi:hypothetical protein
MKRNGYVTPKPLISGFSPAQPWPSEHTECFIDSKKRTAAGRFRLFLGSRGRIPNVLKPVFKE